MEGTLYTFWRSSASYRVRIALNLKGLDYNPALIHFRKEGGQHRKPEFLAKNPQGLVPVWEEGDWALNQSLAIIEYLDETNPDVPLIPQDAKARAEVRAMAQVIACEMHPVNNLRVLMYLKNTMGLEQEQVDDWYRHWCTLGFETLEPLLEKKAGKYCFGDDITLVDCCLVPQLYNARRFNTDLSNFPNVVRIDKALNELDAFIKAAPENQPDAE